MCTVSIFDKTTVNDTVDVHSTQYTSQYSNRTDVPLYMSTVVISTRTSTTFHTVIMHMPHTHTEGVPRQRDGVSQEGNDYVIPRGMQEGHRITRTHVQDTSQRRHSIRSR
jgi:hypothetical protein